MYRSFDYCVYKDGHDKKETWKDRIKKAREGRDRWVSGSDFQFASSRRDFQ